MNKSISLAHFSTNVPQPINKKDFSRTRKVERAIVLSRSAGGRLKAHEKLESLS